MKNKICGISLIESHSIPMNCMVAVLNNKIIESMGIPNRHFNNAVKDGISAVEIRNEREYRFLSNDDMKKFKYEK